MCFFSFFLFFETFFFFFCIWIWPFGWDEIMKTMIFFFCSYIYQDLIFGRVCLD